jgi:hypothetical protein
MGVLPGPVPQIECVEVATIDAIASYFEALSGRLHLVPAWATTPAVNTW